MILVSMIVPALILCLVVSVASCGHVNWVPLKGGLGLKEIRV